MMNITIYQSNGAEELFVKKDKARLTPVTTGAENHTVVIDEEQTFQEMDGFGASFTDLPLSDPSGAGYEAVRSS